ncbi:transketolase-like protein 1 [Arthrobacter sp. Hiyo6]|nr:transketolase-like protein 1 [Arthrobacter sp. Hiyo6]
MTLIGAGVTLHECLTAAGQLAEDGSTPASSTSTPSNPSMRTPCAGPARRPGQNRRRRRHYPEGGIGAAVLETLAGTDTPELHVVLLAVKALPTSGAPQELLDAAGISAMHISTAARRLLSTG